MPTYQPGPPFEMTSYFGEVREDGTHGGTDYEAPQGTPIPCAVDGVVVGRGWHDDYGNLVIVKHDDPTTRHDEYTLYAHTLGLCFIPAIGTRVARGQAVGVVGSTGHSTGPHLHVELMWVVAGMWLTVEEPWEGDTLGLPGSKDYYGRLDTRVEANWYGMTVYQATEDSDPVAAPSGSCHRYH
ncbi:MAG: M23 family metallopeptidase [Myxococcales bacterium]|nr:M23 family metallopeptidase [Myxococcales bacterium]